MTTRKYNAVKRLCALSSYPETFNAVFNAATEQLGATLDGMTARQIAVILEFGYRQHTDGEVNVQ